MSGVITLPWPPRALHPNARPHHMERARAAKAYRTQAYRIARAGEIETPDDGEVMLDVRFFPPDRRRRDLDSMLSNIKAGLDGIADALGVNDWRFAFTIRRCEPSAGGRIDIRTIDTKK